MAPCRVFLGYSSYLVTAPNLVGHVSRVSTDYHLSSIANDLRPYREARAYSLIIGHSLGAVTALHLFPHLLPSHLTAIVLDPPMQQTPEGVDFLDGVFTDSCINAKPPEVYVAENTLWRREDNIYRELGTRLCSVEAIHAILSQNRPWYFFDYFVAVPEQCKVTVVVADLAINKVCMVEDIQLYPHIRAVMVPSAGHWIQCEFPEVIVDEALKTVAGLEVV